MTPDEIKAKFPEGAAICEKCGHAESSREVFVATHTPPEYTWRSSCGHASLRWKNAPAPPKPGIYRKVASSLKWFFIGPKKNGS